MTKGLLISRKTKISLLKSSLIDPTQLNKDNYRRYRNLYNTLLRTSKKMHIDSKLKRDSKNPKKIWDTIKEFTTGKSSNQTINKINSQLNLLLTDQTQIAEEFNTFFAGAGHKVANSIDPVNIDPMDYLKNKPPPPEMYINEISHGSGSGGSPTEIQRGFQPPLNGGGPLFTLARGFPVGVHQHQVHRRHLCWWLGGPLWCSRSHHL